MLMPFGRYYTISLFLLFQAGVIAFLFLFYWQMLLPMISGRCYTTEADVIAYCIFVLYYG